MQQKEKDLRALLSGKAAGLESYQIARESNRFNTVFTPQDHHNAGLRRPRIGRNSRNESNNVFQFAAEPISGVPSTKFQPTTDPDRFSRLSASQEEKERINNKKEKFLDRIKVKRDWKRDIETNRWDHENQVYEKAEKQIQQRRKNSKNGMHSVSYNLITLDYRNNQNGQKLREKDAEAKYRLSIRAAKLYSQNNSFDPTRCIDIPRFSNLDSSFLAKEKPAGIKTRASDSSSPAQSVPAGEKTIAECIKSQIELHENRVKDITGEKPILKDALLHWRVHF